MTALAVMIYVMISLGVFLGFTQEAAESMVSPKYGKSPTPRESLVFRIIIAIVWPVIVGLKLGED